jgi:hypothetical protein
MQVGLASFIVRMRAFDAVYHRGTHDGFYRPNPLVAVSSTATFSSGYGQR